MLGSFAQNDTKEVHEKDVNDHVWIHEYIQG